MHQTHDFKCFFSDDAATSDGLFFDLRKLGKEEQNSHCCSCTCYREVYVLDVGQVVAVFSKSNGETVSMFHIDSWARWNKPAKKRFAGN